MISTTTKLTDLAEPGESIYDNLNVIGNDLIDATIVGDEWGWALDSVLREHGDEATVDDLRRELYARYAEVE